jgi:hypothetical protein
MEYLFALITIKIQKLISYLIVFIMYLPIFFIKFLVMYIDHWP